MHIYANPAYLELFGFANNDQILGSPIINSIAPSHREQMIRRVQRRSAGEEVERFYESRGLKKDGAEFDAEFSLSTYTLHGEIYSVASIRDITERKLAETALRESEAKFKAVIENSNDSILFCDVDGRILYRSPRARATGYSDVERLGKLAFDIVHSDDMNVVRDAWNRAMQRRNDSTKIEFRTLLKDGSMIFVDATIQNLLDNPNVRALVVAMQDITERKRVENALLASEEKYRTLVDGANEGILVAQDGLLKFANHQAMELSGYLETELLEKPFSNFIHPDDHQLVADYYKKRLNGESAPSRYTFRMLNPDKSIRWIENSSVLIDWKGMPATLNFLTDISERKRLEKEKEQLQAQFLQAQKMEAIGTLAGGVAHDFNNLLTAISGFTTIAMGKIPESDAVQKDLRQVSTAATRAAGLTRQLLLFSRKQHMEPMPLDINATISRLLKMLARLIGENIVIETSLEKELWRILGDEGNIEQVLMNLSVNARDAMPEGGKLFIKSENVTIDEEYCRTNKGTRPGCFVCLSVSDTGTGMDKLTQQRIFEPFFTTKGEGKGTGLGLSVVFGVVEQHKGWINVCSEIGHGATFKVFFPSTSDASGQKSKEEVPVVSLEGKGERIMVVEDQDEVRAVAEKMLASNGYSVFPVSSAKEAIELFEKENGRFDLVFSDVVLPDMTGILLVQELHKRWKFKVIVTSGYTDEKTNWDFIKEKNFRFLHKPYSVRDLLQAVKDVLA